MKKVFIISIIIIVISLLVFFIPNSLAMFSFSGESFFGGQVWRLLTFSFTHVNAYHLIENVVAMGIIGLLAFEFGLEGNEIISYFLVVSIIIALIEGSVFPALIIAGASLGIYSVLGSLSIKGSNFIPKYVLIPLLGLSVFVRHLYADADFRQTLFHFIGFVGGISGFYLSVKLRRRKRILTGGVSR